MCIRDRSYSNRQSANNCFPQIEHYIPAFVAAHRRAAIGNQRTTCFPQIAHYTPSFVAAHRRTSLLTPAVRSSSKSQDWITHRPAALCSCHSLNPLHASVLKQGPSSMFVWIVSAMTVTKVVEGCVYIRRRYYGILPRVGGCLLYTSPSPRDS